MVDIYSYRIVIKAEQSNSKFNLDLYSINNEPFGIILYDRLDAFMSTNTNRADSINPFEEIENDSETINFVCYFSSQKLSTDDQNTLDEVDLIVVTAIQEAIPTKEGLPQPPIYTTFINLNDTNSYGGVGKKKIYTFKNQVTTQPETYIPDTTQFKKRGLVKIQGEEDYRSAGQIIGKDLQTNPESVSSDNQTHVNGSETDEQVENSIAVSVWYFKNKTTGDINTLELKSKIPKSNYTSEYQRIKGILG